LASGQKPMNSFHLLDSMEVGLLGNVTFEDLCDFVSDLSYFRDDELHGSKILPLLPPVENDRLVDMVLPPLNVGINLLD
jgi:hypothetical protein